MRYHTAGKLMPFLASLAAQKSSATWLHFKIMLDCGKGRCGDDVMLNLLGRQLDTTYNRDTSVLSQAIS